MHSKKRVFITGYGSVNAVSMDNLGDRDAGVKLARHAPCLPLEELNEQEYARHNITRRMDRFSLLAYIATCKAIANAAIERPMLANDRSGIVMNTCFGPLDSTRRYMAKLIRDGAKKVPAAVFPNTVHNAFTGLITMELGLHGSNSTVSGQNPVCYGFDMIHQGNDDLMIVGGCDELLPAIKSGFDLAGYTSGSDSGASVFDRHGGQFYLGEGAAVLVLESEESMARRDAAPLAEILNYGMANGLSGSACEAFPHDTTAIVTALRQSLARSGIAASDVDYISAASNGVARVAGAEIDALHTVFDGPAGPIVGNVKSLLGETLGGASVFSTIFALDVLRNGSAPPIHGLAAGLLPPHFVAHQPRSAQFEIALVNAFELGGCCTSLALRRTH